MSRLEWCEITGSPSEQERTILLAALEQSLAEEEVSFAPTSGWVRGELPVLPTDPPGKSAHGWRRPAARKVAIALGGFSGVAASVALAIKLRHHHGESQDP